MSDFVTVVPSGRSGIPGEAVMRGRTAYIHMQPPAMAIALMMRRIANQLDGKQMRQLLERIVNEVARPAIAANFESEGRRLGGWAELKESTKQRRERAGWTPIRILDRRRGAVGLKSLATAKARWKFVGSQAQFTNLPASVFYGESHQFGYRHAFSGHRVPRRPFVALNAEDEERIVRMVDNHIGLAIARA